MGRKDLGFFFKKNHSSGKVVFFLRFFSIMGFWEKPTILDKMVK